MSVDLRDRLAEIEAEHASLKAEVRAFQADYMRHVGVIMAQVHDLEARILTLTAERSGSERRPAGRPRGRGAGGAHVRADARGAGGRRAAADRRLKQLFREAAKRMHPDLVRDADGRVHAEAFMKRLNDAYRADRRRRDPRPAAAVERLALRATGGRGRRAARAAGGGRAR